MKIKKLLHRCIDFWGDGCYLFIMLGSFIFLYPQWFSVPNESFFLPYINLKLALTMEIAVAFTICIAIFRIIQRNRNLRDWFYLMDSFFAAITYWIILLINPNTINVSKYLPYIPFFPFSGIYLLLFIAYFTLTFLLYFVRLIVWFARKMKPTANEAVV